MTARSSSVSRKTDVPPNFMLKWQSRGPRSAKGTAHRPLTACRACRTAKTRCDGKRNCKRCITRGLVCSFENLDTVVDSATASPGSHLNSTASNAQTRHSPPEEHIAMQASPLDLATDAHTTASMTSATGSTSSSNLRFEISAPGHTIHSAGTREPADQAPFPLLVNNAQTATEGEDIGVDLDLLNQLPGPEDWDFFFQSLPSTTNQFREPTWTSEAPPTLYPLLDPTQSTIAADSVFASPTTAVVTCDVSRMHSTPKCPCRDKLTALLPQVNDALQENRLDRVFEITHDVMRAGKGIIDCTSCDMRCVDLICMMSIFRQTDRCFEFIAQADSDSSITMSYGGSDLPVCDPQLRAMLVVNLVHYTSTLLDEVGTKGHKMLEALNPPNDLAKTNIAYLDSVIGDFKAMVARVVKSSGGGSLGSPNN